MNDLNNCKLTFTNKDTGNSASITLYSHFSLILGKDSGEGKTHFFEFLRNLVRTNKLDVNNSLNLQVDFISDDTGIRAVMDAKSRHILFIDEVLALSDEHIKMLNKTKHIIVCITRYDSLNIAVPMCGIYYIKRVFSDRVLFEIEKAEELRLYKGGIDTDIILTEAREGRSENELLSLYLDNVVSAGGGNGEIFNALSRKHKDRSVVVMMDLGNIGSLYGKLLNICRKRGNVYFYDYNCFEELLYRSNLINKRASDNIFNYLSLERYFEKMLERSTLGTDMYFKHGEKLPVVFLDKNNFDDIFNTDIGREIYVLIRRRGKC